MKIMSPDNPSNSQLLALTAELAELLGSSGLRLATAESCTGGWIAKLCTDLTGSSAWFECGFVTYSNQAKQRMLGVSGETLVQHGAVSEATVREMVAGVFVHSEADLAVAISGIAGPGGATPDKPLGMVCFAWGRRDRAIAHETCRFSGDRDQVRRQAVAHALRGLSAHV